MFFKGLKYAFEINETIVILIQKNNNLETLKDYKPTSLYNIFYGVVAKCI
jgi:hypothetical protein